MLLMNGILGQVWTTSDIIPVIIPEIADIRNTDTVGYFPQQIHFPIGNTNIYLQQAVADIIHLLREPENPTTDFIYGNKTTNSYIKNYKLHNIPKHSPTPKTYTYTNANANANTNANAGTYVYT